MSKPVAVVVGVLAVIVVAVLAVGVWQLDWFVTAKNVDKSSHIDQHRFGRQVGIVDAINEQVVTIDDINVQIAGETNPDKLKALNGQRKNLVQTVCSEASNLNDTAAPTASAQQLIATECR